MHVKKYSPYLYTAVALNMSETSLCFSNRKAFKTLISLADTASTVGHLEFGLPYMVMSAHEVFIVQ